MPTLPATADSPLVGRVHELAALSTQLDLAMAGQTRIALLAGEAGIGKTRILDWVSDRAAEAGTRTLRGGASQAEGMPPYLPLIEALGGHARSAPRQDLEEQLGEQARTLSALLPGLATEDAAPLDVLPADRARVRFFEAAATVLERIAADGGLVLLLDDLQWADGATFDLLTYLARTRAATRLLLVGAFRDDEAGENPALPRYVDEMARLRRLTTVRIQPLSVAEIETLGETRLGSRIEPELGLRLHERSEGNPFYAEELLRLWLDSDAVRRHADRWALTPAAREMMPESVAATVRRRLDRLGARVVEPLRAAAIIGRSFDVVLLAAALGDDPEAIEEALADARSARVIEPAPNDRYTFLHDRIRECLYSDVPATRRRRLHEAIGLAIERQAGRDPGERLNDLAFHFAHSGDRERGIAYCREAGEDALRRHAVAEAGAHFQSAIDQLGADDARRGELLILRAGAGLLAGQEGVAAHAYEAAHALLLGHDPIAAARAAHGMGVARLRQDDHLRARVAFEAALALLPESERAERVRILVDLATLLCVTQGEWKRGIESGERALALAREMGDPRTEAAATRAVGNLYVRGNRIEDGVRLVERALVLAQAVDDPAEMAECCACLTTATYWRVDLERSRGYTLLREECARRLQQPFELRHIYSWLAFLAATRGDLDEADAYLARARPVVEELASAEPLAFLRQVEGFLALERGDFPRAERELAAAATVFRSNGPGELIWYLGMLGVAQLRAGHHDAARATLDELHALFTPGTAGTLPAAAALLCATLIAVGLGDGARADGYAAALEAFAGQLHWYLVDDVLFRYHHARDDAASALAALERAGEAAARAGMYATLAAIQRERAALESRSDRGGAVELPAGLSRREVEVLALVAAGLSNREIAARLYLSEHTVAKHITSIFRKTESENRAAAATFAARHGLIG